MKGRERRKVGFFVVFLFFVTFVGGIYCFRGFLYVSLVIFERSRFI